MVRFGSAVFVGAFLLFQVQLIVSKRILPWFGGSALVWSTAMVFFQVLLLFGYSYADLLTRTLQPARQRIVHLALLGAAGLFLPILPAESWKPAPGAEPFSSIVVLLAATVGFPFFLLAASSPLLSAWYSQTHPGPSPYRLYSLSNAGSLLGLVSFPFVLEPSCSLPTQGLIWSIGFLAYFLLSASAAWPSFKNLRTVFEPLRAPQPERSSNGVGQTSCFFEPLFLAAGGTALLLTITAHITQNIAPIPLLWAAPLALYLTSFILTFAHEHHFYRRAVFLPSALVAIPALAVSTGHGVAPRQTLALFLGGLFLICMALHGELARLQPPARHLTRYYLAISLGGALGGTAVTAVAPRVFKGPVELPLSLIVIGGTLLVYGVRAWFTSPHRPRIHPAWIWGLGFAPLVTLAIFLGADELAKAHAAKRMLRNFYGSLTIIDEGDPKDPDRFRNLLHGIISHGTQFLAPERRLEPTGYYFPDSGVGRVFSSWPTTPPRNIGVIGLGAGALAAYGRPGDQFTFFEINPQVIAVAQEDFSYLSESKATCKILLGDGRLLLEQWNGQPFDILVLDAFSGDSVPVHLLTKEAFDLYFRRLKPNGILAVHMTNKHLDFTPILATAAGERGLPALVQKSAGQTRGQYNLSWGLIPADPRGFERAGWDSSGVFFPGTKPAHFRPWTDDFTNLLGLLR